MGKSAGNNRGQILIEAMVAMVVISIGLLGAFSVLATSLGISKVTSNEYVGTYLASEGIEVVKNIIDTNVQNQAPWNQNLNSNSPFTVQYTSTGPESFTVNTPLLFDPKTGVYSYNPPQADKPVTTIFTRSITVTAINNPALLHAGDELKVDSVVNWKDQGGTPDSVWLQDIFYNWQQQI